MRASEFINEGMFGDLQAMGRANQAAAMSAVSQKINDFKGRITPQFFKNISANIADKSKNQQIEFMADRFAQVWDQTISAENARRPAGQAMTLDEYKRILANWLAKATKTRLDSETMQDLNAEVTAPETDKVRAFFTNKFIPKYLTVKTNPVYSIPDGTKVTLQTVDPRSGNKVSVEYEWEAHNAGWKDIRTGVLITGGPTHTLATNAAMSQVAASQNSTAPTTAMNLNY